MDGSSPLARGLHGAVGWCVLRLRIIPARAGFTPAAHGAVRSGPDHPRSRGVYFIVLDLSVGASGSSPLARGLRRRMRKGRSNIGIIPARAGFTMHKDTVECILRDHPRSRGVYVQAVLGPLRARGSSPLARGLQWAPGAAGGGCGIIPARAGFTLADPWNPNEPVLYQTPAAFTADLGPAPPSCGSAVVVPRWTTTPSGA